jgi:hypothetical protein
MEHRVEALEAMRSGSLARSAVHPESVDSHFRALIRIVPVRARTAA